MRYDATQLLSVSWCIARCFRLFFSAFCISRENYSCTPTSSRGNACDVSVLLRQGEGYICYKHCAISEAESMRRERRYEANESWANCVYIRNQCLVPGKASPKRQLSRERRNNKTHDNLEGRRGHSKLSLPGPI